MVICEAALPLTLTLLLLPHGSLVIRMVLPGDWLLYRQDMVSLVCGCAAPVAFARCGSVVGSADEKPLAVEQWAAFADENADNAGAVAGADVAGGG